MIERLEGELLEVAPEHLLINIGGIGIRALVPRTVADRVRAGTRVTILTRLIVRDGEPQLYGFLTPDERACFDALISVSGVGPRIGLGILSFLDPAKLAVEVEKGSSTHLLTVPGVGRKLAGRILLELKGRLSLASPVVETAGAGSDVKAEIGLEAIRALTALGYPSAESREAVRTALGKHSDAPPALDQLLREALIGLSRGR